jgi:hypothetical protein
MAKVWARIGCAKEDLELGIERLGTALDQAVGLPKAQRKKYETALKSMKKAQAALRPVDCIQPHMSYNIPSQYYQVPPGGRTASRKKTASSKKKR